MKTYLVAPCGINCNLCMAYLREKNRCPGCRVNDKNKPKTRTECKIKNCMIMRKKELKYCSKKCGSFPCESLKNLCKRYQNKYETDVFKNLNFIEEKGIRKFVGSQTEKYVKNGKIFCIHNKMWTTNTKA